MRFQRESGLRLLVWAAVAVWGVSLLGVFLPWSWMEVVLQNLGKGSVPVGDPMLRYWLRMATASWNVIGFLFLSGALHPKKCGAMLPLLAWASVFVGIVLLLNGPALSLPPFPFFGYVTFCIGVGGGILLLSRRGRRCRR